jgi:hypothetical protein
MMIPLPIFCPPDVQVAKGVDRGFLQDYVARAGGAFQSGGMFSPPPGFFRRKWWFGNVLGCLTIFNHNIQAAKACKSNPLWGWNQQIRGFNQQGVLAANMLDYEK